MAWLTNWTYRKAIVIAHSDDGAQTDYQIKLLVGESSGATGEQVDCESHVASDFDDLRFTTSDGETLCPYWIESITGATPNQLATIWVKVSVAAHPDDTVIYMYYGGTQTAVSSGANTFGVNKFDDFEWGNDEDNIDTNGGNITWTKSVAGTSTAKIDTAQKYGGSKSLRLYCDGTNLPVAYFYKEAGNDYAIRFRWRKEDAADFRLYHGDGVSRISIRHQADEVLTYYDGATYQSTGDSPAKDAWHLLELKDINWTNDTVDIVLDDVLTQDNADVSFASAAQVGLIYLIIAVGTVNVWIDDVIVRKWTANEPAYSSAGGEEAMRAVNLKLTAKGYRRLELESNGYRDLKMQAKQYRRIEMTEK